MSEQHQEQYDVAPEMAERRPVGEWLRSAREARGDTLSDAAHALKLSRTQVEALEAERFDLLPGPVFVRGFLRNYARYLGLDPDAVTADLAPEPQAQPVKLTPDANAAGALPTGDAGHKVKRSAMALIGGMVLVLAAGWYFDWFNVPGTTPEVSGMRDAPDTAREPLAQTPATPPAWPPVAAVPAPAPAPHPSQTADDAGSAAGDGELADAVEADVAASGQEAAADPAGDGSPTSAAEAGPVVDVAVEPPDEGLPPGTGELVFRMEGESWIQVRDADGTTLFTGTGAPGTTRTVQGKAPFVIVVGNAALVSLEHDGRPVDLASHTSRGGVARMVVE